MYANRIETGAQKRHLAFQGVDPEDEVHGRAEEEDEQHDHRQRQERRAGQEAAAAAAAGRRVGRVRRQGRPAPEEVRGVEREQGLKAFFKERLGKKLATSQWWRQRQFPA
jgi:hypothetical protein